MSSSKLILEVAAKTDKGRVRDGNEDNFLFTRNYMAEDWVLIKEEYPNSDAGTVMIVADGMGGLNAGEVASKIAVDSIRAYFGALTAKIEEGNIRSRLIGAVVSAHEQIVLHGRQHPETLGMGSTIILGLISGDKVHLSWVGDSRCYLFRDGKLSQLSKDQSYVQTLVDKGEITREQAFFHPESNIITQSLGDADHVPKPDYTSAPVYEKDMFILCSDGLNSMLMDADIERHIAANPVVTNCAEALVQEANNAGGHDNITVIVAKIVSAEGIVPPVKSTGDKLTDSNVKRHPAVKKMQKGYQLLVLALVIGIVAIVGYFQFGSKNNVPGKSVDTIAAAPPKPTSNRKDTTTAKSTSNLPTVPENTNGNNEKERKKDRQQAGQPPQEQGRKDDEKKDNELNSVNSTLDVPIPKPGVKPGTASKDTVDALNRLQEIPQPEATGTKQEKKPGRDNPN